MPKSVIVVTGASRGIGPAIAGALASETICLRGGHGMNH